jgi:hypothetical protein
MEEREFYDRCALILGIEHDYREPTPVPKSPNHEGLMRTTYKNRYNGREPGNGRFVGAGIVRNFGTIIQVRLTTPHLHGNFKSFEDALLAITRAMELYAEHLAVKALEKLD